LYKGIELVRVLFVEKYGAKSEAIGDSPWDTTALYSQNLSECELFAATRRDNPNLTASDGTIPP
jgi:hypothetical protein